MQKEELLTQVVAENIQHYRKKMNLTQSELAEKLGYSDKSISKWERAEGIPSVFVLSELSDFFGITLNDMTSKLKVRKPIKYNKRIISYFYASISLFVGIIVFGVCSLLNIDYQNWMFILFGTLGSLVTLYVFSICYKQRFEMYLYLSLFVWMLAVVCHIVLPLDNSYIVYIIAIPVHIFLIYLMKIIFLNKKK